MSGEICQKHMDFLRLNISLVEVKICFCCSLRLLSHPLTSDKLHWPEISCFRIRLSTTTESRCLQQKLSPGQTVRFQNEASGLWELTGVIVEMRPDRLSY